MTVAVGSFKAITTMRAIFARSSAWARFLTVVSEAAEPHVLFPLLAFLILIATWTATLQLINTESASAKSAAIASAQELLGTYESQVVRALREIDQTLKIVQYVAETKGRQLALSELQERSLLPPNLLFVVSLTDSRGEVAASTGTSHQGSVSDEQYFVSLRDGPTFANQQLRVDRTRDPPSGEGGRLQFSRRLNDHDGSFAGVVTVAVDAAYFVSGYEASKLGLHGMLGLLGTDGVFRVRRAGGTITAGDVVNYTSVVGPGTAGDDVAVSLGVNPWDNVRRYSTARELYEFPLAVVVGLSEQEQLAATALARQAYLQRAAIGSALVILLAWGLSRLSQQLLLSRRRESATKTALAQRELGIKARQSGMAEVANNVLHNVGNVLNSVNISAGLIGNNLRDSKIGGLAKAVQLMNEHATDLGDFLTQDERGKILPGYLNRLAGILGEEKSQIAAELVCLTKSIDHIKEIVAAQQSYSGSVSLIEPVQVKDLLEDALRMNAGSIARHQITVIKEVGEIPLLLLDKHLVLQILINLIGNAKHAMDAVPHGSHELRLKVDATNVADEPRLRIRVEDDGEGISSENLTRLFAHGFTTRANGHGFGLHSCALAAKEMHGTISAFSEGQGRGATFTLELPMNPATESA